MRARFLRVGEHYAEVFGIKGPVRKLMTVTRKAYVREGRLVPDRILLDRLEDTTNCVVHLNDAGHRVWEKAFKERDTTVSRYDAEGRCIQIDYYKDNILTQTHETEFDAEGKLLSSQMKDSFGTVTFRSENIYRPDGQVAEVRQHHQSKPEPARAFHIYDGQGRRTGIESFTAEGKLDYTNTYVLDGQGRTLEETSTYMSESMKAHGRRIVNIHNDKGDIVAQTYYDAYGKVTNEFTYNYEYDSQGNKIIPEQPVDEARREEVLNTDQHGNWTRQVVYYNKVPLYIQERAFVYADMPDMELVHPLDRYTLAEGIDLKDPIRELEPMPAELLRWVMDVPGMAADQFPVLRYYTARFNEAAVPVNFHSHKIENMAFYEAMIKKLHAIELHSYHNAPNGEDHNLVRYTLELPYYPGYMVQAYNISHQDADNFIIPDHMPFLYHSYAHLGPILLLKPRASSTMYDKYVEEIISDIIDECTLVKRPSKPRINVIEVRGTAYAVVEHPVSDSFTIRDLDINYGEGFGDFHNELMNRFKAQSKGLVLFHGIPGTGKTYYIRHLLRQMAASKKRVLYMPPNMVDHLTDPGFMTFLINTVKSWSHEGDFCVLLIEDAEPLLAKRQEGVRIQGVTNLLNMTDGLLNDMLNLQIICTFNVDLRKLDSALLRPGRLLARKEFRPLGVLDANLLAQRLGIKHHFKGPASLSEIYSYLKDSSTLIHDVDPNKGASSSIDDLM